MLNERSGAMLLLFCALALPRGWAAGNELAYSEGDVTLVRQARTIEAEPGLALFQGDTLRTGRDGLAIIKLARGAEIKVRENTSLDLDGLEANVSLTLRAGGVFSKVDKLLGSRYTIRTESAVAGVRGTEFFVAYGRTIDLKPDVWLCVNDGSVEVAIVESGEKVVVEEGKGINIIGGTRLTAPRGYAWTRRLNWNTDPSGGSVFDKTDLDQAYSDLLDQDYE